jgi:hypothetical protein
MWRLCAVCKCTWRWLQLQRDGISTFLLVPDSCHIAAAVGLQPPGRYLRPIIVRAFVAWMPRSWRPAVKVWGAVMKVRTGCCCLCHTNGQCTVVWADFSRQQGLIK